MYSNQAEASSLPQSRLPLSPRTSPPNSPALTSSPPSVSMSPTSSPVPGASEYDDEFSDDSTALNRRERQSDDSSVSTIGANDLNIAPVGDAHHDDNLGWDYNDDDAATFGGNDRERTSSIDSEEIASPSRSSLSSPGVYSAQPRSRYPSFSSTTDIPLADLPSAHSRRRDSNDSAVNASWYPPPTYQHRFPAIYVPRTPDRAFAPRYVEPIYAHIAEPERSPSMTLPSWEIPSSGVNRAAETNTGANSEGGCCFGLGSCFGRG